MTITLSSPGPIMFHLGTFAVSWYSFLTVFAFICNIPPGLRLAKRYNLSADLGIACALTCYVLGLLFARLYFVALNMPWFLAHPVEIIGGWSVGRSIHGALIGAVLGCWLFCRVMKISFWACCDIAGVVIPLGQAIGRWGNFFNSEAYGLPVGADFPLKVFIPPANRLPPYQDQPYFHATFLYESVWDFVIFLVLYTSLQRWLKPYPGATFAIYLSLYSVGRFAIESMRTDSIMCGPVPAASVASVVCLFIGTVLALNSLTRGPRDWTYKNPDAQTTTLADENIRTPAGRSS